MCVQRRLSDAKRLDRDYPERVGECFEWRHIALICDNTNQDKSKARAKPIRSLDSTRVLAAQVECVRERRRLEGTLGDPVIRRMKRGVT